MVTAPWDPDDEDEADDEADDGADEDEDVEGALDDWAPEDDEDEAPDDDDPAEVWRTQTPLVRTEFGEHMHFPCHKTWFNLLEQDLHAVPLSL